MLCQRFISSSYCALGLLLWLPLVCALRHVWHRLNLWSLWSLGVIIGALLLLLLLLL
jgi:hypothetical protein